MLFPYHTPYAWLPSTSGSVGAGPLSADAGVSSSKIISDLQLGAMLDIEVDYKRWSLENDLVYAKLGSSIMIRRDSPTMSKRTARSSGLIFYFSDSTAAMRFASSAG